MTTTQVQVDRLFILKAYDASEDWTIAEVALVRLTPANLEAILAARAALTPMWAGTGLLADAMVKSPFNPANGGQVRWLQGVPVNNLSVLRDGDGRPVNRALAALQSAQEGDSVVEEVSEAEVQALQDTWDAGWEDEVYTHLWIEASGVSLSAAFKYLGKSSTEVLPWAMLEGEAA